MATRDLGINSAIQLSNADTIIKFTSDELIKSYRKALTDIRKELTVLHKKFLTLEEPTKAELTRFMRKAQIEKNIVRIMKPYLTANEAFIKDMTALGVDNGYFTTAWAIDQAAGVSLGWGMIDDTAVRAVAGSGRDLGNLAGLMARSEVNQYAQILDNAFVNYSTDSIEWITRDVRQGIIKGESAVKVAKRLQERGIAQSFRSGMRIARTEIMRATGVSSQISYQQAMNAGVNLEEIWDATLDDRTRPDHAEADGTVRNKQTGLFSVPWGDVAGPRRSGQPSQDINCRCVVVAEVQGYSPELRRVRGEGLQPYQNFSEWAQTNDIKVNRYGQKYNF
jgi:hypothetical protein